MKKIAVTALLGVLLATQLALAQVGIFGRGGRTGIVGASITPETADVGEECILTVQIAQGKTPFDKLILGSSDPKVVQVPSEVALLAGQTVVTVKVRALAPGAARINLAVGDRTRTLTLTVRWPVGAKITSVKLTPDTLTSGKTGRIVVELDRPDPVDNEISMVSSNPEVASGPSSIRIPAGKSMAEAAVSAHGVGKATFAARLRESTQNGTLTVVGQPARITGLAIDPAVVEIGLSAQLRVTVQRTDTQSPLTVTITNSSAEVVDAPRSVVIPPGGAAGTAKITGLAMGTARLTASTDANSFAASIQVRGTQDMFQSVVLDPPRVEQGKQSTLTVKLNRALDIPQKLTLTSSNVGVATLTASVDVQPGKDTIVIPVKAVGVGVAQLSAQFRGGTRTVPITVTPAPLPVITNLTATPSDLFVGDSAKVTVTLDRAMPNGGSVTLANAADSVLAAHGQVAIAPGASSGTVTVQGKAAGKAALTAALGAFSRSVTLTVAEKPAALDRVALAADAVGAGQQVQLTVTLNKAATAETKVALKSSATAVATVAAQVTIAQGQTSATTPVSGVAVGSATLTAELSGVSRTASLQVKPAVPLAIAEVRAAPERVKIGQTVQLAVTLTRAATAALPVTLSSSDAKALSAPATLTVPAGKTSETVTLTSARAAEVTLTATAAGSAKTARVLVVPPQLSVVSLTLAPPAVLWGQSTQLTVTLDWPAEAATDVALTSSDAARIPVPPRVTVPAGQKSASLTLTPQPSRTRRQLTTRPSSETDPAWSPKGSTIAFLTDRDKHRSAQGEMPRDIWAIEADGSNERPLAIGPDAQFGLATGNLRWLGQTGDLLTCEGVTFHEYLRVMLSGAPALPVKRMAYDGNDRHFRQLQLIPGGLGGGLIAVSPDGALVAWEVRTTPVVSGPGAKWQIRLAQSQALRGGHGAGTVLTTSDGAPFRGLCFSPDRSQVLVARQRPGGQGTEFLLHQATDGRPVKEIAPEGMAGKNYVQPDWSSTGKIAFASDADGDWELYLMNPDGTGVAKITDDPASDSQPSWSPDGSKIAFTSNKAGNNDLWAVEVFPPPVSTVITAKLGASSQTATLRAGPTRP